MAVEPVGVVSASRGLSVVAARSLRSAPRPRPSALAPRMPLSVLMVDLNNLKHLNDAHGHGCGDRALALVAEVLRDTRVSA